MANNWFRSEESSLIYKPSRVLSFEFVQGRDNKDPPKLKRGQILPEEVEAWLTDSQMQAVQSAFSLRILVGECSQLSRIDHTSSQYIQIPFGKHKFERVLENMRVQPQFVWALEDPSAQVSRFRDVVSGNWCESIVLLLVSIDRQE